MTMMSRVVLLALLSAVTTRAQFACTLSNTDESSCINSKDTDSGGNDHCVWCSLAGFGFCVGEQQAESMEQNLPGVQCDRYSGSDDDEATDDDATPATDDDHVSPPTDDALPDDFWTCLQKKDAKSCQAADCTWCDSKQYGFGLCMTGPTADSAADSDFFTCKTSSLQDPSDTSCLLAYLQDPTQEGCTSTVDSDGQPCEWCSLGGMANLCLNADQAEMGSPLGITCEGDSSAGLRGIQKQQDPFDPTCLEAFVQEPTEDACEASTDGDGNACQFCTMDQVQLCLTEEQAELGEALGMDCSETAAVAVEDPYDPSCALAFLQSPTPDSCTHAVDQEGNSCEYCTLQGQIPLCLTHEQAQVGESVGLDCQEEVESDPRDTSCFEAFIHAGGHMTPDECTSATDRDGEPCEFCSIPGVTDSLCLTETQAELAQQTGDYIQCGDEAAADFLQDPNDLSCALAYLQDPTEDGCTSATDSDGNACEYCSLQGGALNLCLNEEQAEMAEQLGVECEDAAAAAEEEVQDPNDLSCALAYLQDPTEDGCASATDSDGNACEYCSLQGGALNLCLNEEQAEMAEQLGVECEQQADQQVALPPDFFDCLKHQDKDGCSESSCTWCRTGSFFSTGFCLADAAARAVEECDFFDCSDPPAAMN